MRAFARLQQNPDAKVLRPIGGLADIWNLEIGKPDGAHALAGDDAAAMPPLDSWYQGRAAIATWATGWPLSGAWRWRVPSTQANGKPALGFYSWNQWDSNFRPFALNVLTLRGEQVSGVTAFIARSAAPCEREVFAR